MFRKPAFWVAAAALAALSGAVSLRLFPLAFPIVQLELTMDREAALAAARTLAAREQLGPADYRQAASFTSDTTAQTFVELEGGGKEVFAAMLRDGLYEAHVWRVRHFREGEKHEVLLRFRPDGRPYGFVEQVEETTPGAALSPEEARAIAERKSAEAWLVDLRPFALVEQSREARDSGRIDHRFTYERTAPTLNEGRYRLRLTVTGDRLTEVSHLIRIPQAFSRRYEEMRSANEAIGAAGSIAMAVLYIVGGIGFGLFWLLRHRSVISRPAIRWGVAVGFLQLLAGLNEFPLLWMSYDTALPRASFISAQLTTLLTTFAGMSTLFAFSFMAAESLTRRAFGHHPQLWRLWSPHVASSTAVVGRTLAGYLLVSVFLAYDVLLYFYATRWFYWWTPSEALIHPDILATYLPWLSAIANSLQAGFWEEALFRAVPIAGAALIGEHFGRRRLFIVVAFIVQTIVFGAGHAAYPTQPSYARPVELILPSIAFGLLYLQLGLLPAIVLHYAFDVVWMAMPLFVSTADGIWLDQAIVIVLTFVPLLVILGARLRTKEWQSLSDEYRNAAWVAPPPREYSPLPVPSTAVVPVSAGLLRGWIVAGVLALAVWVAATPLQPTTPPLTVSRADAARIARDTLATSGVAPGPEWRIMPMVESGHAQAHTFVWDVGGRERYEALLGRYLPTPRWRVRVARFDGDITERAEEWAVIVNDRAEAERVFHQLPESRPGAALSELDARTLAIAAIVRGLGTPPGSLREVSAQPAKLAARIDWVFTFQDLTVAPLPFASGENSGADNDSGGEARIEVVVAGNEVVRVRPFVRVPEAWQRDARARATFGEIISIVRTVVGSGALLSAAIVGIMAWSRRRAFARGVALAVFGVLALASIVSAVNRIPSMIATLSTAQPYGLQLAMLFGGGLVGLLLPSAMVALAAGTLPDDMPRRRVITTEHAWLTAGALGLGASAVAALIAAAGEPPWPVVAPLGTMAPLLSWAVERVPILLLRTVTLLALLTAVDEFSAGWTRRRVLFGILLVVAGAVLGVSADGKSAGEWAIAGLITGLLLLVGYVLLLRHDLTLVPLAMGTMVLVGQLADGMQTGSAYALVSSVAGAILVALTSWWLFQQLRSARGH